MNRRTHGTAAADADVLTRRMRLVASELALQRVVHRLHVGLDHGRRSGTIAGKSSGRRSRMIAYTASKMSSRSASRSNPSLPTATRFATAVSVRGRLQMVDRACVSTTRARCMRTRRRHISSTTSKAPSSRATRRWRDRDRRAGASARRRSRSRYDVRQIPQLPWRSDIARRRSRA